MKYYELAIKRKSTRDFKDKKVAAQTLNQIKVTPDSANAFFPDFRQSGRFWREILETCPEQPATLAS